MKGRKPTPTHLKLVKGNPGKRPLNEDEHVPEGEVVRPAYLTGRAAELWDERAPELIACKVLTARDVSAFSRWCRLQARFEEDDEAMPAALVSQIRSLESEFGMTPVARARVGGGNGNEKKDDPASRFFA